MRASTLRLLASVALVAALVTTWLPSTRVDAYTLVGWVWTSTPTFLVNPTNFSSMNTTTVAAAAHAAIDTWVTSAPTAFTYTWGGNVADTDTAVDGRNVLLFKAGTNPNGAGMLASTSSWIQNGVLYDSDVTFWQGAFTAYVGSSGCTGNGGYVDDIMTHEYGHVIGLQHSDVSGSTMYYAYYACTQDGRTLAADDIAGLQFLYPATAPPPPPPPPTPDPPPVGSPTLTARGYKVKGVQRVDLQWAYLTTAVDLYRTGVRILTATANDGAHTDLLKVKGGGTYTYKACNTTTTVCTNTVTVTF